MNLYSWRHQQKVKNMISKRYSSQTVEKSRSSSLVQLSLSSTLPSLLTLDQLHKSSCLRSNLVPRESRRPLRKSVMLLRPKHTLARRLIPRSLRMTFCKWALHAWDVLCIPIDWQLLTSKHTLILPSLWMNRTTSRSSLALHWRRAFTLKDTMMKDSLRIAILSSRIT